MDKELKDVLNEILLKLNSENSSLYYYSTSDIASEIKEWIEKDHSLPREKKEMVKDLNQEQIQYLLSFDERENRTE